MAENPKNPLPSHETPLAKFFLEKRYQITWRAASTVISTTAIMATIGYLLDNFFQTKPIFFIVCLVLAFPLSIMIIVKITRNLIKKLNNGQRPQN